MYNKFQFDIQFTKKSKNTKNVHNLKKCIKSKPQVQIGTG